jgi:hypothetical protein
MIFYINKTCHKTNFNNFATICGKHQIKSNLILYRGSNHVYKS